MVEYNIPTVPNVLINRFVATAEARILTKLFPSKIPLITSSFFLKAFEF